MRALARATQALRNPGGKPSCQVQQRDKFAVCRPAGLHLYPVLEVSCSDQPSSSHASPGLVVRPIALLLYLSSCLPCRFALTQATTLASLPPCLCLVHLRALVVMHCCLMLLLMYSCLVAARRDSKVRKCCEQDSEGRACTKKRRGIFQADTCSVQADASSVQALPADILLHIFTFTHPKAQREVLPLVCRQWQEVLQGPVALWRHLELDFPAAMDLGVDGSSLAPSRCFQVPFLASEATITWHVYLACLVFADTLCCISSQV